MNFSGSLGLDGAGGCCGLWLWEDFHWGVCAQPHCLAQARVTPKLGSGWGDH